jgi:hypothetical protein
MRGAGNVACMEMHTKYWQVKQKGRNQLEDIGTDGKALTLIL